MTRRELRELRNAAAQEEARTAAAPEPATPQTAAQTVAAPDATPTAPDASTATAPAADSTTVAAQESEVEAAMAAFDRMRHNEQASAPPVEAPAQPPAATRQPFDSAAPPSPVVFPEPVFSEPVFSEPVARPRPTGPSTPITPVAYPDPVTVQTPVAPPPPAASPETATRHASADHPAPDLSPSPTPPVEDSAEPLREVVTAPEVYSTPQGHWSTQAAMDDRLESVGGPHQRDISASDAITTSALVMPNFPVSSPTTGPVSGTGETLMTGSINLPRSLGVTGLHPSRYDRADIDDIIDAADREDASPNSAPVRAVRAVSTYTSSHGIINAKRPKGNNLPMILSITAGVMMVGVVVLVVVGMIFKIF